MIQLNPNNMVRIELTSKEQKAILKHCQSLDRSVYDRIANARDGVLHLLIEDCQSLRECVHVEVDRAKKPKVQDVLGKLYNKLTPNPITRDIAEEISGHNFESLEDANELLQEMMDRRNTAPDAEMGGLSPEQVSRLIYLPWDDNNFPLKFNKELSCSDIKDSIFFTNTAIFLKTLVEMEKEPTATAGGSLNRKIVKKLFDTLILDEDDKRFVLGYNKVINEIDVFPLHVARIVCESAGIIHKRKNKFLVTKKYQNLLSEDKTGELYHLLFNAYFRKFNIGYLDVSPDWDCIQDTVAYSLHRIGEVACDNIDMEDLSNKMLLPAVKDEVNASLTPYTSIEWILSTRIVEPLQGFGLLECSYIKKKWQSELATVRKTELFDKFIRVEW